MNGERKCEHFMFQEKLLKIHEGQISHSTQFFQLNNSILKADIFLGNPRQRKRIR